MLSTSKLIFSFNLLIFFNSVHLSNFLLSMTSIFPQYLLFLYENPKNPYIFPSHKIKEPFALSIIKSGIEFIFFSVKE